MMLKGQNIALRPVLETDLDDLYRYHTVISNRGEFYPIGIQSQATYRQRFHDTGFWGDKSGRLLIVNTGGAIIGEIEFFPTVSYLSEYEIAYLVYQPQQRGKGVMTEALSLFVRYLFETKPVNRLRLMIHPDNAASRRVAEKCGFTYEGIARKAWYNRGKHHDLTVYSILHDEVIPPGEN